jgi:hypothetical protein
MFFVQSWTLKVQSWTFPSAFLTTVGSKPPHGFSPCGHVAFAVDSKPPHGFSPCGHVAYAPVQTAYKPSAVLSKRPTSLQPFSLFTIPSRLRPFSPFTLHSSLFLCLPTFRPSDVDSGAPPAPSALRATSHALVSKTATSLHRFSNLRVFAPSCEIISCLSIVRRSKLEVRRWTFSSAFQSSKFGVGSSTLDVPICLPKFKIAFLTTVDSKPPHGFSPCGHLAFAPVQTAYKPSAVFTLHSSPFTLHFAP